MTLPEHLKSTGELLTRAFPRGIDEGEYMYVLAILYPHMADGNLTWVATVLTGRDEGLVMNDVLKAYSFKGSQELMESTLAKLKAAGLDEWIAEDEL
ncbi:MAG: hypothetical protein H6718_26395 [Polyangiaceae bacterium]|nr:hypothetical protein [Myxococcales bacterium]MCB9588970.1 hypothetical protein [Polyangiaceae bacterium]